MSAEAWVAAVALGLTVFASIIGWATYVAWMLSNMNANLKGLRLALDAHKADNDVDHREIWKAIHEIAEFNKEFAVRLAKVETQNAMK